VGDLEHPLGTGQVGQPMLAQVDETDLAREVTGDKVGGALTAEHLTARSYGHEPGGTVERRPEVVVRSVLRRARAHPHFRTRNGGSADHDARPRAYWAAAAITAPGTLALRD
jgi:hypothetical protein